MTAISHSIVIARPVDEVFAFVTNLENDIHWYKAVSRTEKLTPGPVEAGTEFDQVAKVMAVAVHNHLTVTDYQPLSHVTYHNDSPQLAYDVTYCFEPVPEGTRFTLNAELELKGILRRLLPLAMGALHGQLNRYFTLLKAHLERHPN